jgi:hypothetical protein
VTEQLADAEEMLLVSLAATPRGREQNGAFALWLFVRTCSGVLPPEPVSAQGHRQRVSGLGRRLARLRLPSPLRRALAGGLREIASGVPQAAAVALQQLVAPARETIGPGAGDAVALAARAARDASREARR